MNIDEMPSGREMDALIAEKLFGWKRLAICPRQLHPPYMEEATHTFAHLFPYYSNDIAAAFDVLEKLRLETDLRWRSGWTASIAGHSAIAVTVPLAICRAALKIIGMDS